MKRNRRYDAFVFNNNLPGGLENRGGRLAKYIFDRKSIFFRGERALFAITNSERLEEEAYIENSLRDDGDYESYRCDVKVLYPGKHDLGKEVREWFEERQ